MFTTLMNNFNTCEECSSQVTCSSAVSKVQPIRNDDLESAAGFMEKMEGITSDFTNVLERNLRLEEKVLRFQTALEFITSINNQDWGGDWDEIEQARRTAREALK